MSSEKLKEKDLLDKKILVNKIQCKKCNDIIESNMFMILNGVLVRV